MRYRVSVSGLSKFVRWCGLAFFVRLYLLLGIVNVSHKYNRSNLSKCITHLEMLRAKNLRYYSSLANSLNLSKSQELEKNYWRNGIIEK